MSVPAKLNLVVHQGASYRKRLVWKGKNKRPINLTGYTARMVVRQAYGSEVILFDLSTANGGIVLFPTAGTFEIVLTREQILAVGPISSAVYDILFFAPDGVTVIRRLEGSFKIAPGATL